MKIINQFGIDVSEFKNFRVSEKDNAIVSGDYENEIAHAWYKNDNILKTVSMELNDLINLELSDDVVYVMPKGYGNELYTDDEMIESYEKYKEKTEKE